MSLRWKIAVSVGVLTALATLSIAVASHRATGDRLIAEVDRSLVDAVQLLPRDQVVLPQRGPLEVFDVQIVARDGSVRATTFDRPLPVSEQAAALVGRSRVRHVETVEGVDGEYRVLSVGIPAGVVQISRSLEEVSRVLSDLRTRSTVLVVVVSAAAMALALVIASGVTASLRRLTSAAGTVESTGRLDVDLDVPTGSDEAGRLGAAFASMLAALRRSRDEQQRLVDDAGHELKTPLTSLRTNLAVLERYPDLPADQRAELLADLRAETEELVALVDEIVLVARGAADEEPVEELHLADTAERVVARFERRTGRTVHVDADDSVVRAPPAALERAIANLLDNAGKFAPDGPLEVRVTGGALEVLDRGPGIPDGDLGRVFERFHRSEVARALPGSGLGLAIVRDVVTRAGGEVTVRNRGDGGAAVGFRLPVVGPATRAWAPPPPPVLT